MVITSLVILLMILLIIGAIESYLHSYYLNKIPIRIHVNGARGKSSVTRLIASGLRESGKKVFAKTTGSSPRIINEKGQDIAIHRLRSASIGEQVRLIRNFSKQNIDILIIECMAVQPQYQWISEQKMVQSSVGVITNVRPDHLDEMGYTMNDIACSLSNGIPSNGTLVVHNDRFYNLFQNIALNRKTEIKKVDSGVVDESYMKKFNYFEHQDNVELSLSVCKHLGMDEKTALKGMLKNKPDPGALFIWETKIKKGINFFISAFAANDPQSTFDICSKVSNRHKGLKRCIFLNTRSDRQYRTHQLLSLVYDKIVPEKLIIRGSKLDSIINNYDFKSKGIEVVQFDEDSKPEIIIDEIGNLNQYLVFGIGNIVGWGDKFVQKMKEFKISD